MYTECASSCQKSCENHFLLNIDSESCKQGCSPGCVCQEGFLRDANNTCTALEDCTCVYRAKLYRSGEYVQVDCNACECMGGQWRCTEKKCPRTCSIIGRGHFHTFDGKEFDFVSNCEYVVLEVSRQKNLTSFFDFFWFN